ncbi:hypothetical protein AEA09_07065 [Lysinibacillus contaminans]|uniref:LXG domain-containing protein n=1 Tax=Lysinibacillus contaminans TaxID=1293441 RepID=A0ABR5K1T8_9BACI|nr:hypothetical protein [Lysinibacillus contaminans]KOS68339.1 hypothetical protein AEA09_07065 [Lysinibacillus contaminans]
MYSNTANMKKQTSNLINSLIRLKGNLSSAKTFMNSDKIPAIYFFSNAYSDFNLFKAIYQTVTPGDSKIDTFLQDFEEFYQEVNKYVEFYAEDNAHNQLHKEITASINEIEIYLLNLKDMY